MSDDLVIRIIGWDKNYENNRTRELKRLDWLPIPNRMDGDGYTELVDHENGAAHFGAWMAIVQIASKCDVRGTLMRDGAKPHNSRSLSRISRIPAEVFDEVLPRLKAIGWIELIPFENVEDTKTPHHGAGLSHAIADLPHVAAPRARAFGREWKGMEENGAPSRTAPPCDGFDEWFECQYARHPKKHNRTLAKQTAVAHFTAGKFTLDGFEKTHTAWCSSEDWRWKGGVKVKQSLAEWISDENYRYMPSGTSGNGHAESKLPTASELRAKEAADDIAEEAARIARRQAQGKPV